MSDARQRAFQAWISAELALDGVLAAGGGLDLSTGFAALAMGELVLAGHDPVWHATARAIARVQAGGMPVGELLWGFEHAVLCTIQRSDGAWLGVFTIPKMPDEAAIALRARLDAFKEQPF